jgi:hypothetical protein
MHFEKLDKSPLSGEYHEKHFGNVDSNPLWIKFHPDEEVNWIGSFENGGFKLENEKFLEINTKPQVALLKNGAFYIVDYVSKELIFHPDDNYFVDFEISSERNQIFLATFWGIYIYQDNKLTKEIRPEFIDGIRFIGMKNETLFGEIYEPGLNWSEFKLNTKTLVMKWGKFEFK